MQQPLSKKYSTGFTLVESLVIIVIISILSLLSASALPRARDNQNLTVASQQLQSLLREAQQRALNEVRSSECLDLAGSDKDTQKRCSNVGVGIQGTSAVLFSDLDGGRTYEAGNDFLISTNKLVAEGNMGNNSWQTLIFEATPPSITLFADGRVVAPDSPAIINLQAGRQSKSWAVYPYGRLEAL